MFVEVSVGVGEVSAKVMSPLRETADARKRLLPQLDTRARYSFALRRRLLYNNQQGTKLKTNEERLRTREEIRARAAKRHKARDKALPVGQRPVKRLWLLTLVFSGNLLMALFSTWMHRFVLLGLLNYVLSAGSSGSFPAQMWDLLSVFNVFLI